MSTFTSTPTTSQDDVFPISVSVGISPKIVLTRGLALSAIFTGVAPFASIPISFLPTVSPLITGTQILSISPSFFPIAPSFSITPYQLLGLGGLFAAKKIHLLAKNTFSKTGFSPAHGTPVSSLLTTGIFSWTRNPLYLTGTVVSASIGIGLNSLPFMAFAAFWTLYCHFHVIPKEEAFLSKRFGKEWIDYKKKVARWFLFF